MPAFKAEPIRMDGFPKGVDNLRANYDLPQGVLRDGLNVDVLESGRVRMRRGITQAIADAGAHSVFSDGARMVYATPTALKIATPNLAVTTLLSSAFFATPLSYLSLHGEIYFSNEYIHGIVNALGTYEAWGVTPPAAAPALAATAGTRTVMVTCTFLIARRAIDGTTVYEESGAPLGRAVLCGDSPVISVTGIPQSPDPRYVATRLYVTGLNGTVFFQQADVPAGITSYVVGGNLALGDQLRTQFMQPPPLGQYIDYCDGRIVIAAGANVFPTQPMRYGLWDPSEDYLMYPERVTLLAAVENGIYTSADATYFEPGIGTVNVEHRLVAPYKAIEGGAVKVPNSKDVIWLSERGFMRGSPGGAAKNLTEEQLALTRYSRAALGVLEDDGHKAVIAITQGGTASPLVAPDYVNAEISRLAELE